mmetsp:Transcript_25820/g.78506  ORF Transcript_25820/g.78506 Transcript_25820/m.78506 type:complete len:127 (+) Transcript_25820:1780-2160(+)
MDGEIGEPASILPPLPLGRQNSWAYPSIHTHMPRAETQEVVCKVSDGNHYNRNGGCVPLVPARNLHSVSLHHHFWKCYQPNGVLSYDDVRMPLREVQTGTCHSGAANRFFCGQTSQRGRCSESFLL